MTLTLALQPPSLDGAAQDVRVQTPRRQTQQKRRIYLSHSAREMYTTCGRKYKFSHVDRLESDVTDANLGFGGAVHRGCEVFLIHQATGQFIADPVEEFLRKWQEFNDTNIVKFSSRWDREKLTEVGVSLVRMFMDHWVSKGFMVVVDVHGKPVLERRLRIELPDNVVYTAVLDVLAMTPDGRTIVIDLKTPGVKGFDGFTRMSEQLLGQQLVVDAHAEELGVDMVDGRLFYNLYKVPVSKTGRGEGPHILPLQIAERANDEDIADWIAETIAIANDIRNGRFPKRPGDSFNTPCSMCDAFYGLCSSGDSTGLRKKKPYTPPDTKPLEALPSNQLPF